MPLLLLLLLLLLAPPAVLVPLMRGAAGRGGEHPLLLGVGEATEERHQRGVAAEAGLGPGVLIRAVGKTPIASIADFSAAIEKEDPATGVLLRVRTPRGNSVVLLQKQ